MRYFVFALLLVSFVSCEEVQGIRIKKNIWKSYESYSYLDRSQHGLVQVGNTAEVFALGRALIRTNDTTVFKELKESGNFQFYEYQSPTIQVKTENEKLKNLIIERSGERKNKINIPKTYLLQFDLSKIEEDEIYNSLHKLDSSRTKIENASSIDALKTLISISSLKTRYSEKIDIRPLFIISPDDCGIINSTEEGIGSYNNRDPYQTLYWKSDVVNIGEGWKLMQASKISDRDVIVAIIDQGFTFKHNDYTSNDIAYAVPLIDLGLPLGGGDINYEDPYTLDWAIDPSNNFLDQRAESPKTFHGTYVSSVAVSSVNDSKSVAGSAIGSYNSNVPMVSEGGEVFLLWIDMPRNVTNDHYGSSIDLALTLGADVINLSWSGRCGFFCDLFGGMNYLNESAKRSEELGVSLVTSAGNDTRQLDWGDITVPCDLPNMNNICVGATNGLDQPWASWTGDGSNFGTPVDIWAPGVTLSVARTMDDLPNIPKKTGTSLAAPFVAGIIASAIQLKGELIPPEEIKNNLMASSALPSSPDPKLNGVINVLNFLSTYSEISPDKFEDESENLTQENDLYTLHSSEDIDLLRIGNVPECANVSFDLSYWEYPGGNGAIEIDDKSNPNITVTRPDPNENVLKVEIKEVRTNGSWFEDILRLKISSPNGLLCSYSICDINIKPPTGLPDEICDGIDNDCDRQVDEGFADTDGDGIADCVDYDDDGDCILDSDDNCPSVANFSYLCPGGSSCYNPCQGILIELSDLLADLLSNRDIPDLCLVDGCDDVWIKDGQIRNRVKSFSRILQELETVEASGKRTKLDKRLLPYKGLKIGTGNKIVISRNLRNHITTIRPNMYKLPDGQRVPSKIINGNKRRILDFDGNNFRVGFQRCMENEINKGCQDDSDSDGIGNLCDLSN